MECPECRIEMEKKEWGGDDIRYVCHICGKNIWDKFRRLNDKEHPEEFKTNDMSA